MYKRPRIINTLISYQADKLGHGRNKLLGRKGRPSLALGFADSQWRMLMLDPASLEAHRHNPGPLYLPAALVGIRNSLCFPSTASTMRT